MIRLKKFVMLFILIFTMGCDLEENEENNSTNSGSTDSSTATEQATDSNSFWTKEDFSELMQQGIVKIEPYRGWFASEDLTGKRITTEYFQEEQDIISKQFMKFDIVRVHYADNTSDFFMYSIDGFQYYFNDLYKEDLDSGWIESDVIGPVSFSVSSSLDEPHKIGGVEEDGSYSLHIEASRYVDEDCKEVTSGEDNEVSICFAGNVIGGGEYIDCEGFTNSDGAFENAASCLLYIGEDGTMKGESYDYDLYEDEEEFNTRYIKERWGIYPLEDFNFDEEILEEYTSEEGSTFDSWILSN